MFPEGVVIDPGLTVAMNDDTLYGFLEPGQSKPFPAGHDLQLHEQPPGRRLGRRDGVIRTVANGAATVTATATYDGVSRSTQFVVRVLSDLGGLRCDGTPISGFNPDVFNYDVIVPAGRPPSPQVTATAPSGTVAITQAAAVPGVATVTSTGPDGIVATYTVNFAQAAQERRVRPATPWARSGASCRETPADWSLTSTPGSMVITPEAGRPATRTTNTARNVAAAAGARRLDDDLQADVQRPPRTPPPSRAGSSPTATTTTT